MPLAGLQTANNRRSASLRGPEVSRVPDGDERGNVTRPASPGRRPSNRQRTDRDLIDPADISLGQQSVQRWNLPDGWVISSKLAHEALVSESDVVAAQDISAARGPAPCHDPEMPEKRRYLLAGLLVCASCGRRMESSWSHGSPAYRCRHARTKPPCPTQAGPGTPTSARTASCRACPPCPCSRARRLRPRGADGAPAAEPTSDGRPFPRT